MVNTMAASEAERLAATKDTTARTGRFFPRYSPLKKPLSLWEKHTSPSVAAKLSCKLTPAAAKGSASRITSSAADRLVSPSLSRRSSGAASRNICMMQARTTEGVRPTITI